MTERTLRGVIPPMVTPFKDDESIDHEAFVQELEFLLQFDIDGLSIGGSTGEGAVLDDAELVELIRLAQAENRRRLPIVAGVIRNSTRDAVRLASLVCEAGADALLVTPPFYYGGSPQGNRDFYRAIAQEIDRPLLIYNVVPDNRIAPEDMLALADVPQIVGVKQVGASELAAMTSLDKKRRGSDPRPDVRRTLSVFSACDDMLYPTYVSGACGSIAAINTAVPGLCVEQWRAFERGDHETAAAIHRRLHFVFRSYFRRPFPGRIKQVLQLLGRSVGRARQPIDMPDTAETEQMRALLRQAGLIP